MSFKLGNTNIGELYVGSNKIAKAYLGSTLVYQSAAPGPTFDSVTIGTQTWMSKNLAIDDGGEGIIIKENVTANGVNFGTQYYYTWDAAVRVAASIEGWHLPTYNEWKALATFVGGLGVAGTKLKSTTGWDNNANGDDSYGFAVFPIGRPYSASSPYFPGKGNYAWFWTAFHYDPENMGGYLYFYTGADMSDEEFIDKSTRYNSVRLIKD